MYLLLLSTECGFREDAESLFGEVQVPPPLTRVSTVSVSRYNSSALLSRVPREQDINKQQTATMKKNQVDARREVDEFEGKFHFRNELDKARFRLYNATEKGILSEVNAVLTEFPQLLNSRLHNGRNGTTMRALHVAASNNEIDVFNYLLTFPEIDVNVRTRTGETPLHIACGQGSVDVVNVLLRHPDAEIALPRYKDLKVPRDCICERKGDKTAKKAIRKLFKNSTIALEKLWSKLSDRGLDRGHWNHQKLILLGQEGSGKTTLLQGLFGEDFKETEPTIGIEIQERQIRERKKGTKKLEKIKTLPEKELEAMIIYQSLFERFPKKLSVNDKEYEYYLKKIGSNDRSSEFMRNSEFLKFSQIKKEDLLSSLHHHHYQSATQQQHSGHYPQQLSHSHSHYQHPAAGSDSNNSHKLSFNHSQSYFHQFSYSLRNYHYQYYQQKQLKLQQLRQQQQQEDENNGDLSTLITAKDVNRNLLTKFMKPQMKSLTKARLYIYDVSGKDMFTILYPYFLPQNGIFLITFDMKLLLNKEKSKQDLCWKNLYFWMNFLSFHLKNQKLKNFNNGTATTGNTDGFIAPSYNPKDANESSKMNWKNKIIFIGTRKDKISKIEDHEKISKLLEEKFATMFPLLWNARIPYVWEMKKFMNLFGSSSSSSTMKKLNFFPINNKKNTSFFNQHSTALEQLLEQLEKEFTNPTPPIEDSKGDDDDDDDEEEDEDDDNEDDEEEEDRVISTNKKTFPKITNESSLNPSKIKKTSLFSGILSEKREEKRNNSTGSLPGGGDTISLSGMSTNQFLLEQENDDEIPFIWIKLFDLLLDQKKSFFWLREIKEIMKENLIPFHILPDWLEYFHGKGIFFWMNNGNLYGKITKQQQITSESSMRLQIPLVGAGLGPGVGVVDEVSLLLSRQVGDPIGGGAAGGENNNEDIFEKSYHSLPAIPFLEEDGYKGGDDDHHHNNQINDPFNSNGDESFDDIIIFHPIEYLLKPLTRIIYHHLPLTSTSSLSNLPIPPNYPLNSHQNNHIISMGAASSSSKLSTPTNSSRKSKKSTDPSSTISTASSIIHPSSSQDVLDIHKQAKLQYLFDWLTMIEFGLLSERLLEFLFSEFSNHISIYILFLKKMKLLLPIEIPTALLMKRKEFEKKTNKKQSQQQQQSSSRRHDSSSFSLLHPNHHPHSSFSSSSPPSFYTPESKRNHSSERISSSEGGDDDDNFMIFSQKEFLYFIPSLLPENPSIHKLDEEEIIRNSITSAAVLNSPLSSSSPPPPLLSPLAAAAASSSLLTSRASFNFSSIMIQEEQQLFIRLIEKYNHLSTNFIPSITFLFAFFFSENPIAGADLLSLEEIQSNKLLSNDIFSHFIYQLFSFSQQKWSSSSSSSSSSEGNHKGQGQGQAHVDDEVDEEDRPDLLSHFYEKDRGIIVFKDFFQFPYYATPIPSDHHRHCQSTPSTSTSTPRRLPSFIYRSLLRFTNHYHENMILVELNENLANDSFYQIYLELMEIMRQIQKVFYPKIVIKTMIPVISKEGKYALLSLDVFEEHRQFHQNQQQPQSTTSTSQQHVNPLNSLPPSPSRGKKNSSRGTAGRFYRSLDGIASLDEENIQEIFDNHPWFIMPDLQLMNDHLAPHRPAPPAPPAATAAMASSSSSAAVVAPSSAESASSPGSNNMTTRVPFQQPQSSSSSSPAPVESLSFSPAPADKSSDQPQVSPVPVASSLADEGEPEVVAV